MSKERKSKTGILFTIIYAMILFAVGIYLWHCEMVTVLSVICIIGAIILIVLIINIIKSLIKRKITTGLKVTFYLFLIPLCLLLGAIGLDTYSRYSPTEIAKKEQVAIEKEKQAIAKGKTTENTKVTVNENGVKIYGKIVDINTASEVGKKVITKNATNDKKFTFDHYCIYSEYYSDAYGGMLIIRTDNKVGSQEIYNEEGQRFLVNDSKAAKYDLENTLTRYVAGNRIAKKIDEKYRNNK